MSQIDTSVQQINSGYVEAPHLLIVDDEPDKAIALKDYMERMGFMVTLAYGGQQALDMVYEESPDLVILDLIMPDMDGLMVCQHLKQDANLGYLPIIVVTDDHEKRKRLEVGLSGADDYLPKPVNGQDLFLRVSTLLRVKAQFDHLLAENRGLDENLQEQNEILQQTLADLRGAMAAAAQAEILKRQIIESVDHELRTPMLQIKSAVSILASVVTELSEDEKNHTVARMATQAVARMEELIQNISQLHLIEHLKPAPFILNDSITQSIHTLRRSWAHRDNVERIQTYLSDLPPVMADRRAVSRILYLLLDNALKFSADDSLVEVRTGQQDVDTIWVAVQDNGIGIAEEHHQKVFEPFFQVDAGITRKWGGVGVGLASAQMLAHRMGIEIHLQSALGEGSTFFFELSIARMQDY